MCGSIVYLENITRQDFFYVGLTETSAIYVCVVMTKVELKAKVGVNICIIEIIIWKYIAR